jgi:hypothetical protein
MKRSFVIILIVFVFQKSYSQDSIPVLRHYNYDKPKTSIDSFIYETLNTIFISLDEGFDDSLYITVNDSIVLNKYLKSNESIGYASGFHISFNKLSDIKILKLKFVKANFCIVEKVNLGFKSLEIRGLRSWLLNYTNQFPMRE